MEETQGYILIAEDDGDISRMLTELLTLHGYRTAQAFSGTEALLYVKNDPPEAVILDLMLPGLPGEEVLPRIREEAPGTAVIVASAKDNVNVKIDLLRAGADDYLTKPFDNGELLARLTAVLRRRGGQGAGGEAGVSGGAGGQGAGREAGISGAAGGQGTGREAGTSGGAGDRGAGQAAAGGRDGKLPPDALCFRDITLYPSDFTAFAGNDELSLTRREYLILQLLMEHPGKVFTKSNIYESVWNEEFFGEDNAVNVHISNLRQKLAKLRPGESYIQTVWGIGFKMKP